MEGVEESQCRAGEGFKPPPRSRSITKVLGELILGEKARAYGCIEKTV